MFECENIDAMEEKNNVKLREKLVFMPPPPPVLDIVDKSRHFVIGIQVSGPLVYSDFI